MFATVAINAVLAVPCVLLAAGMSCRRRRTTTLALIHGPTTPQSNRTPLPALPVPCAQSAAGKLRTPYGSGARWRCGCCWWCRSARTAARRGVRGCRRLNYCHVEQVQGRGQAIPYRLVTFFLLNNYFAP